MPASRLRKLRTLFRIPQVDLRQRSVRHALVRSLQHTNLCNNPKTRWAAQQTLLAPRQNFGPAMTSVTDQPLTAAQIHASQVRIWRTSFGARPAPVSENNLFAPALVLPNHIHRLLAIRWHLGTFPIPPTNPRAAARVKQLRPPLQMLSTPHPPPDALLAIASAIEKIRRIGLRSGQPTSNSQPSSPPPSLESA